MQSEITEKVLASLAQLINRIYNGNTHQYVSHLHKAIYMLHYLPQGEFTKEEIKEVSFALSKTAESLEEKVK